MRMTTARRHQPEGIGDVSGGLRRSRSLHSSRWPAVRRRFRSGVHRGDGDHRRAAAAHRRRRAAAVDDALHELHRRRPRACSRHRRRPHVRRRRLGRLRRTCRLRPRQRGRRRPAAGRVTLSGITSHAPVAVSGSSDAGLPLPPPDDTADLLGAGPRGVAAARRPRAGLPGRQRPARQPAAPAADRRPLAARRRGRRGHGRRGGGPDRRPRLRPRDRHHGAGRQRRDVALLARQRRPAAAARGPAGRRWRLDRRRLRRGSDVDPAGAFLTTTASSR